MRSDIIDLLCQHLSLIRPAGSRSNSLFDLKKRLVCLLVCRKLLIRLLVAPQTAVHHRQPVVRVHVLRVKFSCSFQRCDCVLNSAGRSIRLSQADQCRHHIGVKFCRVGEVRDRIIPIANDSGNLPN